MLTKASTLVDTLPSGSVGEYGYTSPKQFGVDVQRTQRILNSSDNTHVTGKINVIRFKLPNTVPIDFRRSHLSVDVTITTTGGTYKRMSQGSWSAINRLRIHSNNETIEERTNYNRQYSLAWNSRQSGTYQSAMGQDLYGVGTQAQRNAAGALLRQKYFLPIDMGFLNIGVLPLHALQGQQLELEIYLERADGFIETDGTAPEVEFSNCQWFVTDVTSDNQQYEAGLTELVRSGKFKTWFESQSTFQSNIAGAQADLIVAQRSLSLNTFTNFMVDMGNVNNTLVNDKYTTWPKLSCLSFQFKIAGKPVPDEEVICDGQAEAAYAIYLKSIGAHSLSALSTKLHPYLTVDPTIRLSSFNTDQFLMIWDFRNSDAHALNNVSTASTTSDVVFKLKLGAAPPVGTAVLHIMNYNVLVEFIPSSGGNVKIRTNY